MEPAVASQSGAKLPRAAQPTGGPGAAHRRRPRARCRAPQKPLATAPRRAPDRGHAGCPVLSRTRPLPGCRDQGAPRHAPRARRGPPRRRQPQRARRRNDEQLLSVCVCVTMYNRQIHWRATESTIHCTLLTIITPQATGKRRPGSELDGAPLSPSMPSPSLPCLRSGRKLEGVCVLQRLGLIHRHWLHHNSQQHAAMQQKMVREAGCKNLCLPRP